MVEKNIFTTYDKVVSRLEDATSSAVAEDIELSGAQSVALEAVKKNFSKANVQLLYGVTGSGKTEIYIKLIDEIINTGRQVLFLLPEIALTGQIINRLRKYFGGDIGIYHSRYSQNERVEVWNRMTGAGNPYKIIVGARSAVFLPFTNLGLVIVDEEHDTSYKQYDPAPRYNGRDAAIYLAKIHGAKCLLGSATPSIETFYKAKTGKYSVTDLKERYGNIKMPSIEVVDTVLANKNKAMKSHFSTTLLDAIGDTLKQRQQVILFRNRRGFSLRLVCDKCQWSPECKSCDVTLTFHKHLQKMKCHYCGYSTPMPDKCPACGSKRLRLSGFGTEKVETELPVFFPGATIRRMDLDTTRGKHSYMQIINDFEEKRIDILVGTQMVTKGLDFENVGLVGVLDADSLINFPDFRSSERAFQMLMQVSGRAGRKNKQGRVIIQTSKPENATIQEVVSYDYESMYRRQIAERQTFKYPPFYRMIRLSLKHKDYQVLNEAADYLAGLLRERLGGRVIGPEYPLVARIKNYFIKNIIIKFEIAASQRFVKDFIIDKTGELEKKRQFRQVIVAPDVDPY
jgi:primosomal protein N' (replication factor Y)